MGIASKPPSPPGLAQRPLECSQRRAFPDTQTSRPTGRWLMSHVRDRSIPPHTFSVLHPAGHLPRSPSPRGPLDRSRSVPPRAFPSSTGFAFALVDDARRDGDDSRRKEPDPAMVAKEIDALLTCMGPKRGLAIGRAAGRPENVGDVLRGVGRKSVWRESPVNRSIGSVGHRCHGHGQSPGGWVSSSRSTSASFRTAHRLFA